MNCPYCGVTMNKKPPFSLDAPRPKGTPRKRWHKEHGIVNLTRMTKDHIMPQSRGGLATVLVCYGCNQNKGHLTVNEWRAVLAVRYATLPVFAFERRMIRGWIRTIPYLLTPLFSWL